MAADKRNRKQRKELARQLQSANPGLEVVHPRAAGIDVGNGSHYVAVRPDQDPEPVRRFKCFTADLHRLAVWLEACGVETMQSTGVFSTLARSPFRWSAGGFADSEERANRLTPPRSAPTVPFLESLRLELAERLTASIAGVSG